MSEAIRYGLDYIFLHYILTALGCLALLYLLLTLFWVRSPNIQIALRNVVKNKRRSIITLLAIIVAVSGNVFLGVYFNDMTFNLREISITSETGHVQIMKEDFLEKGAGSPAQYLIEDFEKIRRLLEDNEELSPYLDFVMGEIRYNGILSAGATQGNVQFLGRAVETDLDEDIISYDFIAKGSHLDAEDRYGIILGDGLAAQLGISTVDDYVTILSLDSFGSLNVMDGKIRGILKTFIRDYGNVLLKSNLSFAQELLGTQGVNKILIYLNETEATETVIPIIRDILDRNGYANLATYDWYFLLDYYRAVSSLFSTIYLVVSSILYLVVVFSILNTMNMSVFERFTEFGTLRSIGLKKYQLINMVIVESIVLGLIGSILGILIIYSLGAVITRMAIPLPPPPGISESVPLVIVPTRRSEDIILVVLSTLGAIGISSISTILPAMKAAKLKIVDCLRYNT